MRFLMLLIAFCFAEANADQRMIRELFERNHPSQYYGVMKGDAFTPEWLAIEAKIKMEEGVTSRLLAIDTLVTSYNNEAGKKNASETTEPHQLIDKLAVAASFVRGNIEVNGKATFQSNSAYIKFALAQARDVTVRYRHMSLPSAFEYFSAYYGFEWPQVRYSETTAPLFAVAQLRLSLTLLSCYGVELFRAGSESKIDNQEIFTKVYNKGAVVGLANSPLKRNIKKVANSMLGLVSLPDYTQLIEQLRSGFGELIPNLRAIYLFPASAGVKLFFNIDPDGVMRSMSRPTFYSATAPVPNISSAISNAALRFNFSVPSGTSGLKPLMPIGEKLRYENKLLLDSLEEWQSILVDLAILRGQTPKSVGRHPDDSKRITHDILSRVFLYSLPERDSGSEPSMFGVINDAFLKKSAKLYQPAPSSEEKDGDLHKHQDIGSGDGEGDAADHAGKKESKRLVGFSSPTVPGARASKGTPGISPSPSPTSSRHPSPGRISTGLVETGATKVSTHTLPGAPVSQLSKEDVLIAFSAVDEEEGASPSTVLLHSPPPPMIPPTFLSDAMSLSPGFMATMQHLLAGSPPLSPSYIATIDSLGVRPPDPVVVRLPGAPPSLTLTADDEEGDEEGDDAHTEEVQELSPGPLRSRSRSRSSSADGRRAPEVAPKMTEGAGKSESVKKTPGPKAPAKTGSVRKEPASGKALPGAPSASRAGSGGDRGMDALAKEKKAPKIPAKSARGGSTRGGSVSRPDSARGGSGRGSVVVDRHDAAREKREALEKEKKEKAASARALKARAKEKSALKVPSETGSVKKGQASAKVGSVERKA
jgi:hypothetical protein